MAGHTFGRRRVLQGLGAGLCALPFLRHMPRASAGDDAPKRLVVFFTGNEPGNRSLWQPGAPGPLTALPPMLAALEPYRHKLTMIGGLELQTRDKEPKHGGHIGIAHMLTGALVSEFGAAEKEYWGGGVSVDQYIAGRLGVQAMTLGVRPGAEVLGHNRISYLDKDQPVHPIVDPLEAFNKWFGAVSADPAAVQRRARNRSVLDFVAKDLEGIKGEVAADDRVKIEGHLDRVREIEQALAGGSDVTCEQPAAPADVDYTTNGMLPTASRRQMDIIAQALACDLTRVASLQIGGSGGGNTPNWPDEGLEISEIEHNLCHAWSDNEDDAGLTTDRVALEAFYFKLYAYLLQQLDAIPEGDGTVLDNTLVVYTKNLGYRHASKDMLFMIGGGGSMIETGRFVDLPGRPHNDLLINLCHLMGFEDVDVFGDPDFCGGPLGL
jgi:hypothetical protein